MYPVVSKRALECQTLLHTLHWVSIMKTTDFDEISMFSEKLMKNEYAGTHELTLFGVTYRSPWAAWEA